MQGKFQKGDRVTILSNGKSGIIVNYDKDWDEYKIELDSGEITNWTAEDNLQGGRSVKQGVAKHITTMGKLTILAKKVIDADLRNMIRVGWLDNSLQLTQDGEDAIMAHYLSENKAAFGKMAEEALKELKKEKDC